MKNAILPANTTKNPITPIKKLTAAIAFLLLVPPLANAQTPPAMTDAEFTQCIARLDEQAKTAGISQATLTNSLAKAKFNNRIIELDRQQPEFTTTFADYFNRRVTDQRIKQGRMLLEKHRDLLQRVSQKYQVPAPYLVAFWGLETNYGSFFGKMSVIDSLATLACDQRRSEYFTTELINALRILDEGAIAPEKMEGSWAGAMGHVQFMPSAFLRHAVDFDGDKKRDLWNSIPDAMASAANFLQSLGWQASERWGREVKLPDGFSYVDAGLNNKKPLTEWARLGVRRADNAPLPIADMEASLLIPAGHRGPAFLVYDNFNVIMRWNRSEFYALAVGHLADRIAGTGGLLQPPSPNAPRMSRDQVMALQTQLNEKGFDTGTPDGIFGPGTRRALSQFQHQQGMVADGFADAETLARLGVDLTPVNP